MNDPHLLTPAAQVVAGSILILMGRKLFWLFVGLVGFFAGAQLGAQLFPDLGDGMLLVVSIVAGLIGAGLAILLQRFAVILAGAIVGGMLAVRIAPLLGLYTEAGVMAGFVTGALLAAVLLAVVFDPALIVLSSVIGAVMVAEATGLDGALLPVALVAMTVVGIVVQARLRSRVA